MVEASSTARFAAAAALARGAAVFPDMPPVPLSTERLSSADRALATAIHRTTLQRWLTLEHMLNRYARLPVAKMEPTMQAVLLTGAAQLLFMGGVADYAAVDEAVKLAGKLVRPQAKGMANAILRKVAALPRAVEEVAWTPGRDRLPVEKGTLILNEPAMPRPDNLVKHLPPATSIPEELVSRWIKLRGREETTRLCLHGLTDPPTIVVVEPELERAGHDHWTPHEDPRCIVWRASHGELVAFLAADRRRRVQDPASLAAGAAAETLQPRVILDYCAGMGTKTRQLALMHPSAQVVATDIHDDRRATLRELEATCDNVRVVEPAEALDIRCDLLLLDVPCSNTGVLARRPEARYRFSPRSIAELAELQRTIVKRTLPCVERGGYVLYTSCSIEAPENQDQARWIVSESGGVLQEQGAMLPGGRGATYHDGSYHALIRLPR